MDLIGKLFVRENLLGKKEAKRHVLEKAIFNADEGSKFDEKTKDYLVSMKNQPDKVINLLASQGYDVLLGYGNEKLIGHMAFQEHRDPEGKNWQTFHFYINEEERGKGYAIPLTKELIKKARQYEIGKVRLGAGGDDIMKKTINVLQKKYGEELNIKSDIESHWVYLV